MENLKSLYYNSNYKDLGLRNKELRNKDIKYPKSLILKKDIDLVQREADYLVDRFKSPEYKPFFLKVCWRVSRETLDRLIGISFELGKNPRAYFIKIAKKEANIN